MSFIPEKDCKKVISELEEVEDSGDRILTSFDDLKANFITTLLAIAFFEGIQPEQRSRVTKKIRQLARIHEKVT
jgi:hypothetical protein